MSSGQILMNKVIFYSLQQRRFEQLNSESDKYESDLRLRPVRNLNPWSL